MMKRDMKFVFLSGDNYLCCDKNYDSMRQIINYMTDDDLYMFSMCVAVIDSFPRAQVKYEFVDRNGAAYPTGFADLVNEQIGYLESLRMTDEEIAFMRRKCTYIPDWFYGYLKGFRFRREWVTCWQDDEQRLHIEMEGNWSDTILLEVKILAIISELYYMVTGLDCKFDYQDYYRKTYHKAERLLDAGCVYSDFGTRRRASFEAEETVVRAMSDCQKSRAWSGRFVGTSNVYLAMKYDLTPVGTMAHEFVCAIGGLNGGPILANIKAMEAWEPAFHGALGIYLYDTYGFDIFSKTITEAYANQFRGMRVDSGDNFEQLRKICTLYADKGIASRTKQITFS